MSASLRRPQAALSAVVPSSAGGPFAEAPSTRDGAGAADAPSSRGRERKAWDEIAASVGDLSGAPSTRYYRACEIAMIRRAFGPLAGKRVLKLDLWNEAFNTRILHWMAAEGAETFGLDLSRIVTHRAHLNGRETPATPRLLRADIRELPFPDGSFDLLYTMGTIEHIEEYRQAVAEALRVLRPGGRAIIGVPHLWNLFLRPLMVAILDAFDAYPYAPEKAFSVGELREVVETAGFAVRARTGILAIPGVVRMADLWVHTRGVPLGFLSKALVAPFAFAEPRWSWVGRFGYLMALVVERPR